MKTIAAEKIRKNEYGSILVPKSRFTPFYCRYIVLLWLHVLEGVIALKLSRYVSILQTSKTVIS